LATPPKVILPSKLFEVFVKKILEVAVLSVKVMAPAPDWVRLPVCVMLPLAVKPSVPEPMAEVPRTKARLLTKATLLAPLLFRLTAPVRLLPACVKLIALVPALKVEVPPTVNAPVSPMPALAAVAIAVKFVPIVEAAKFKVLVFVMVAVVPLVKATLPVKLLLLPLVVKSIEVPAFRVVVPGTTTVPASLMAAPAVNDKLPLLVKVTLGKAMLEEALLKFKVKLRRLVKAVRLVGIEAEALLFARLTS